MKVRGTGPVVEPCHEVHSDPPSIGTGVVRCRLERGHDGQHLAWDGVEDREWWTGTGEGEIMTYDDSLDDDEDPHADDIIVRAKWMMDGAKTLTEAADKLRAEADALQQWEGDGFQLREPVEDDYGFVVKVKNDG